MQNNIIIGVLVVTVIVGVFWYTNKGTSMEEALNNSVDIAITPQNVTQSVFIDRVVLDKPGFVSVREVTDGKIGQILEISDYLESGEYRNIVIEIGESPQDGTDLIVILHQDNGDFGFNPSQDKIVVIDDQVVARYTQTGKLVSTSLLVPEATKKKDISATVIYTDKGFNPQEIIIKQGGTVLFVNEGSNKMWVASNPHPSHTILSTFDQFGLADTGEAYQYTFENVGEWVYHDHVNASFEGTVIVE